MTTTEEHHIFLRTHGFKNEMEYRNHLAKQKGLDSHNVQKDIWAKKKGFENWNERRNIWRYENGICSPYDENIDCSSWLGIHIVESLLPEIYENIKIMPFNNIGFDAICSKDYKIDGKGACLRVDRNSLEFHIRENKTADYFFCVGFDNRKELEPSGAWIIKGTEGIKGRNRTIRTVNTLQSLYISNTDYGKKRFKNYEVSSDLFNKIKELCNKFKESHGSDYNGMVV